jgi:outer membrane protein OmpA-like peptidoglycan-associated protein
MKLTKKLLLSSVLAGLLVTNAAAWDFCSDESQIGVVLGTVGTAVAITTPLAPAGIIVGAVLNEFLCTPEEVKTALKSDNNSKENQAIVKTVEMKQTKSIYFDYDKYELNETSKSVIAINSDALKDISSIITIEGNADARGSDEYNYALGLRRAFTVKTELINAGVKTSLEVISYGEAKPECTENTQECFAKNRRVDFSNAE